MSQNLKYGLLLTTLLFLSSCASAPAPEPIIITETVTIPDFLLTPPAYPEVPQPPRTNLDMYYYRLDLERYICEMMHRADEIVNYATLGAQNYLIPEHCN